VFTFSREGLLRENSNTLNSLKPLREVDNPLLLELEHVLTRLALSKLTELQKRIMVELYRNGDGYETFSSLVRKLSVKLSAPESTLKWSLRGLRDVGLITSGKADLKGIPVSLTYAGAVVAKHLAEGVSGL